MTRQHPDQFDLFLEPLYPVRVAAGQIDLSRFRAKLKRSMAQAIRECPYDRAVIVARMAQYLGLPNVSKSTLDAYTAESKDTHDISIPRFKAFVHATGATWLWDQIVSEDGLTMLEGDEARFAEIARLQQEQREYAARLKVLKSVPVIGKRQRRA